MPRCAGDLDVALADLGFPERPVVFKPVGSSGGRGFRVISDGFDELHHVLTTRQEELLSYRRLSDLVRHAEPIPEFLLMEYLEGDSFSVDVLVREGRPVCVSPQRRLAPRHGSIQTAVIEPDAAIDSAVEAITGVFAFRHLVNIDMAYRYVHREGGVFAMDINPRPSANIAASAGTGRFLLAEAIRQSLGLETSVAPLRACRTQRYWEETHTPVQ
jgi:carbamoyl-phosphate synthase large subunit